MCTIFVYTSHITAFSSTGGLQYIRWGRTTCPDTNGTELLYSGRAAGPNYQQQGGGANYLCLPEEQEYLEVTSGQQQGRSPVFGAEYKSTDSQPALGDVMDYNVPCAVCYTAERVAKIMIPGRFHCTSSSWTREYYGYLMAEHGEHYRTTYECVDVDAEPIPGSEGDHDGVLFWFAEIRQCRGVDCLGYTEGNELPCVVCTK